ncbi:MAG: endolytic transglycosylase MltG [Candidatus Hydrothermales bacterium]
MKLLCFSVSFLVFVLQFILYSPLVNFKGKEERVIIKRGTNLKEFFKILKEKKVLNSSLSLLLLKIYNPKFKIFAGEWKIINSGNDLFNLKNISKAKISSQFLITIPEGYELKKILKLISEKTGIELDELKKLTENTENFKDIFKNNPPKSLEGYLFPDTYFLSYNLSPKEIISIFIKRLFEVLKELKYDSIKEKLDLDLNQILTLASIIEKEATYDFEKKIISSVYYNRLKKGIPLQADPTIQYLLPEPIFPLPKKFLKISSPYNTYINKGLPPGPICSPGKASIEAALYPLNTDFLYFVSKGDGTHIFARTYKEHLKNKKIAKKEWEKRGLIKKTLGSEQGLFKQNF